MTPRYAFLILAAVTACAPRATRPTVAERMQSLIEEYRRFWLNEGDQIFGEWQFRESFDPITDANQSMTITQSDDRRWLFVVGCRGVDMGIGLMTHVTAEGKQLEAELDSQALHPELVWRVDRTETRTDIWVPRQTGFSQWDQTRVSEIVGAIVKGEERLALRFAGTAGTYTAVFSLDGARDAIVALRQCR